MFEVGKKYGGTDDNPTDRYWLCVAVDNDRAWLKPFGQRDSFKEGIYQFHRYWQELPPEPKRWSRWQNVYPSALGGVLLDYADRDVALSMGKTNGVRVAVALIRRDFEQHDGQVPKCVNLEYEPC